MVKIHELSEALTNQIAAGEVIERPASVVKELVENAIDAGSTNIRVDFIDSGLKKITVQDNGTGIAPDQIDLAFTRHATSKIAAEKDLFKISTLGFRGEALASIAAVAHVEILSKTKSDPGVKAEFAAGIKKVQEEAAAPEGTRITVSDLFYNTPARLKYLSSARTEMVKIVDIINRISLGYPQISFVLTNNGKKLLQTSGNGSLKQVAANIYGRKIAENMLSFDGKTADFKVSGLISRPDDTRANRNFISVLLNGRYIKNYQLIAAVVSGYGAKLKSGRYPIAVIDIRLDPVLVDVNVHPTKREVRLSKEGPLTSLISDTINNTLLEKVKVTSGLDNLLTPHTKTKFDELQFNLNDDVVNTQRNPLPDQYVVDDKPANSVEETPYVNLDKPREDSRYLITSTWDKNVQLQTELTPFGSSKSDGILVSKKEQIIANKIPLLTFRGYNKQYIFADYEDAIYLIDITSAQRRLTYDDFLKQMIKKNKTQQGLLEPLVLDFNTEMSLAIKDNIDTLKELGLYFEDFGQDSFLLRTYPTWLNGDLEKQIRILVDIFANNVDKTVEQIQALFALQLTKRSNLHQINNSEANNILEKLLKSPDPYRDPWGNLIVVKLSTSDLNKMFKKNE